jgi:hypothetical protein
MMTRMLGFLTCAFAVDARPMAQIRALREEPFFCPEFRVDVQDFAY